MITLFQTDSGFLSGASSPRSKNGSPRFLGDARSPMILGQRRYSDSVTSASAVERLLDSLAAKDDTFPIVEAPVYAPASPGNDNASMYNIGTPGLSANPSMTLEAPGGTTSSMERLEEDDEDAEGRITSVVASPSKGEAVSHVLKLIILGDASVGKTALIQRFVNGTYQVLPYKPTVGADFYSQKLEYSDKKTGEKSLITLQIWDTAGQERYKSLASSFYRGADVCILVEDASRPSIMGGIEQWHRDFLQHASPMDHENFPFVFVLNKADLLESIGPAEKEWKRRICERFKVSERQALAASAKSGLSVVQAFHTAARIGVKRAVESASKIKQQQRQHQHNALPTLNHQNLINLNARRDQEYIDENNNGCLSQC